jgi:cell wall-associated NlpC family hydrolase
MGFSSPPRPGFRLAAGPAVLTKDAAVSHHYSDRITNGGQGKPGRHRRRSPWTAIAGRAAVVAGSTAAALLTTLQAAPTPVAPLPTPAVTRAPTPATAPVVPLAATRPAVPAVNLAALVGVPARFDVQAAVAAAAPAALRASAMQKALGKIGARYRYGASGPNAFDCSGLVSWAYRSSGRTLPRSSRAMSRVGTPIARSALQPGDLVFFYGGPSHVAIYVGNGKVVHASNPAHPVKLADLNSMPFNSARRV